MLLFMLMQTRFSASFSMGYESAYYNINWEFTYLSPAPNMQKLQGETAQLILLLNEV